MMQQQAGRWTLLMLLSTLIVLAEVFALLYRPAWVWGVAPLLTFAVYISAFSGWIRGGAIAVAAASALGALLGWPFIAMTRLGPDQDRWPSLFYGLLYFGFFVGSGLLVVRFARKLRADSGDKA